MPLMASASTAESTAVLFHRLASLCLSGLLQKAAQYCGLVYLKCPDSMRIPPESRTKRVCKHHNISGPNAASFRGETLSLPSQRSSEGHKL